MASTLLLASAPAQDVGRVSPASLPIPMADNETKPMTAEQVRAMSPWTLSLAGEWKFRLIHGQILNGHFAQSNLEATGLRASGSQDGNEAANAFDGNADTRWCAPNGDFPQYLQARLDLEPNEVTGFDVTWERPDGTYRCQLQGSKDGIHWKTLLDKSAMPGIGDGSYAVSDSGKFKFVRLLIVGASPGSWASIRELKIHYKKGDEDTIWHPSPVPTTAVKNADKFTKLSFVDTAWDKVKVPSNWEIAGYSIPTYDSVDDSVGLYRKWVTLPAKWTGRKTILRFDGALDGAEIYVNGMRAGYHESGYTAFDVDLTGLIKPGKKNMLAIRLSKMTPSVDCETGDYQCMGGIYRDVRLISVPRTHLTDVTVQTQLVDGYRDSVLQVTAPIKGSVDRSVDVSGFLTDVATGKKLPYLLKGKVDSHATATLSALIKHPKLWSAEKPNLYFLTIELKSNGKTIEKITQRFGFRQVEIKNDVVLWNGKPIKCTGICRHDFWPTKGFALTDKEWIKDLTLMKATNINAIRTSHYNHAARFLELCEERGFYILDEVPFCWVNDKVKDPKFAPPLLQRAAETVARDKNRPCVLAWSLGNENPVGIDTQQVHDLVKKLDPTRPSFASGAGPKNVTGQELFDTHYPSPGSIQNYVKKDSSTAPLVITEHPHTFYSRETQDYDPGASDTWSEGMLATWDLLWRSPTILGSFIWEWQSQGIADKFPDHTTDFYYGRDHMRQENNKGIMTAFRQPKPEQWIVKMVYSPVQILTKTAPLRRGFCNLSIQNHYAFTNLSELKFHWTATRGDSVLGSGLIPVSGAPGATVTFAFPVQKRATNLHLVVDRADGSNVTVANVAVQKPVEVVLPVASVKQDALKIVASGSQTSIVGAHQRVVFESSTGQLTQWVVNGSNRLGNSGAYLNLGGAKTAIGNNYYRSKVPPKFRGEDISANAMEDGSVLVTVKSQVLAPGTDDPMGTLVASYLIRASAEIEVKWNFEWSGKDLNLWEIGLCVPLAGDIKKEVWSRDSYFTAYPNGHLGEPVGNCGPSDISFRSSKRGLHFLSLTNRLGIGVSLIHLDFPLIGRAILEKGGTTLVASSEVAAAGPDDLSQSWFHQHDIHASKNKPLTGSFILRAVGG